MTYPAGDVSAGNAPHLVHFEDYLGSNIAIDTARDTLVTVSESGQNPRPVNTIAPLIGDFDDEGGVDFDTLGGVMCAALQPAGQSQSNFYTLNASTGALTLLGPIGGGELIRAMSVEPITTAVPEPSTALLCAIAASAGLGCVRPRPL